MEWNGMVVEYSLSPLLGDNLETSMHACEGVSVWLARTRANERVSMNHVLGVAPVPVARCLDRHILSAN